MSDDDATPGETMATPDETMTTEEAQLIMSMRIYDTLMAIYTEITDGTPKADHLMTIHQNGGLLGPLPALDLNLVNIDDTDDDTP